MLISSRQLFRYVPGKGSVLALLAALALAPGAQAMEVHNYTSSSGDLSAQLIVEVSGDILTITLVNTATMDVSAPSDVLTGAFFDVAGLDGPLTQESALLGVADPSSVLFGGGLGNTGNGYNDYAGAGDIGAEAGYRTGASSMGAEADHAISLVGMDDFMGVTTRFDLNDAHNIQGPTGLGGIEFGIVNAGYTGGGNAPLSGPNALITSSVVFSFSGFTGTEADIQNVSFNYGTEFNPIPEPSAALVFSLGLFVVGGHLRRRTR